MNETFDEQFQVNERTFKCNMADADQEAGPSATTPAGTDPPGAAPFLGTVKLPEFWPDNTDLWFVRADAQFRMKKVTVEQTKFDHVITMLDSKTAAQVMDILVSPPDQPYTVLKARLTKTFALTTSEKASRILDMDGLGDRTPTQCLTIMLNWVPAEEAPGFLFREQFLRQLPVQVRTSLAQTTNTGSDRASLRALADEADKYFRSMGARISAIASANPWLPHPGAGASPGPGVQQLSTPGTAVELESWSRDQLVNAVLGKKLCFFHTRFGAKAKKCEQPCQWSGPDGRKWTNRKSGSGNSQPGQGRPQ